MSKTVDAGMCAKVSSEKNVENDGQMKENATFGDGCKMEIN